MKQSSRPVVSARPTTINDTQLSILPSVAATAEATDTSIFAPAERRGAALDVSATRTVSRHQYVEGRLRASLCSNESVPAVQDAHHFEHILFTFAL